MKSKKREHYEPMTLIAGFKLQDGVAIYSDRQYTTDRIKYNDDKFLKYETEAVKTVVAMAGDHLSALMNTQGFFWELNQIGDKEITIEDVRRLLRTVLLKYYKEEHVPYSIPEPDKSLFSLALAIWTRKDGTARLFFVNRTDVAEIETCDFRGSGSDIGRILAAPLYERQQTISRSTALFIGALLKAQAHDVATGGGLDVTTLSNEGQTTHRLLLRSDATTKALADYGTEVSGLEKCMADPLLTESDFLAKLDTFVTRAKELRWKIVGTKQRKKRR